ncbi:TerB family tellurite resistance protein [Arenibaculum pallidiluteum]|uniref:TerB family tellurite resistance protein n=1 Tax=Arenibaculum pallidiluteum TaxID=2812559 RepID=UPI001A95AE1F|nr:TerB family tellurite resistance protein [Arenibaculum pallidiluteum]
MSIWGKILGGAAGLLVGGPLGALVGAAAGHAADLYWGDREEGPQDPEILKQRVAFTIGSVVLGAKMAKADGVVTRHEVTAFKQVFSIPPEEMSNVAWLFDRAKKDATGFEPYARQIASLLRDHPAVLEDLLDALFHIAHADGEIHEAEISYLRSVAEVFGFGEAEFRRIRAANGAADTDDPHAVLGLEPTATAEETKAAHRRLVRELHPDRLVAEGLPPEFVAIAQDKLAAINAAYDRIKRDQRALT